MLGICRQELAMQKGNNAFRGTRERRRQCLRYAAASVHGRQQASTSQKQEIVLLLDMYAGGCYFFTAVRCIHILRAD
jgi:hypothetical protein